MRFRVLRREDQDGNFYPRVLFAERGGMVKSYARRYSSEREHPGLSLDDVSKVSLAELGLNYSVPYRFGPIQKIQLPPFDLLELLRVQPVEEPYATEEAKT